MNWWLINIGRINASSCSPIFASFLPLFDFLSNFIILSSIFHHLIFHPYRYFSSPFFISSLLPFLLAILTSLLLFTFLSLNVFNLSFFILRSFFLPCILTVLFLVFF